MDHNSKVMPELPQTICGTGMSPEIKMIMALFLGPVCALLLFAMPVFSQSTPRSMPENASAKSYGDGWECDIGYRLNGDACVAVIVPENAYGTNRTYGPGWECLHGFRRGEEATCVAVVVPDGGFLDASGERWHCLRGFSKVDNTCQKITLPANAYLVASSYGSTWECERGFEAKNDLCVAISVPINGYLNTSGYGQPWTCERGFFEQGGLCEAVAVPAHAYFDDATYGKGWKCERGYTTSGTSCVAIDLPKNAHLDRSGNRWECDNNFQNSQGLCVFNN